MPFAGVAERDAVVQRHYRHLAPQYTELLTWSPDFIDRIASKALEKLRLSEDDVLVDIGCGTGMYSLALVDQVPLSQPVIGVDPSEEMLAGIPEDAPITRVAADAVDFSARPGTYDKVLIKEAIHHVERKAELFGNLYERLTPGGIVLLVHVDPRLVQYPLWDAALERCRWWFADPDELVRQLAEPGFEVERDLLAYDHSVPKERYLRMVETGYMSVLTSFEDDELEAGVKEMTERYADRSVLEFTESFDYLTATKPA
jgi:2-polyprenyl-3-methyl-5-hydroxy-6-metoxy-1,4-benzoquinol methylase